MRSQQRFKSEKNKVFNEKVSKIPLNANNDKRIQPINSIETHAYGTSKSWVCKKEETKCKKIIRRSEIFVSH